MPITPVDPVVLPLVGENSIEVPNEPIEEFPNYEELGEDSDDSEGDEYSGSDDSEGSEDSGGSDSEGSEESGGSDSEGSEESGGSEEERIRNNPFYFFTFYILLKSLSF